MSLAGGFRSEECSGHEAIAPLRFRYARRAPELLTPCPSLMVVVNVRATRRLTLRGKRSGSSHRTSLRAPIIGRAVRCPERASVSPRRALTARPRSAQIKDARPRSAEKRVRDRPQTRTARTERFTPRRGGQDQGGRATTARGPGLRRASRARRTQASSKPRHHPRPAR